MSRPLRDTDPSKIHLLTCRIARAELLLVPDDEMNKLIGGVLARYTNLHQVDLYGHHFLSNHYHLLVQGKEGVIPTFAADINREIASRVNRLLRREGVLWGRRYDDQVTLEAMDELEALLYITTNAVKHGLVSHPRLWPGVSCYRQLLGAKPERYVFMEYSKYHAAKKAAAARGEIVHRRDFEKVYTLKLKPLPMFAEISPEERIRQLENLIEERTRKIQNERRRLGLGFLGRQGVLKQKRINNFPEEISKSVRPRCYTKNLRGLIQFRKDERAKRSQYAEASFSFRLGKFFTEFPAFCIRPPLHYRPSVDYASET